MLCHEILFAYTSCLQVVFTPGQQDKCFLCGQVGHLAAKCEGKAKRKAGECDEKGDEIVQKKPYQVIKMLLHEPGLFFDVLACAHASNLIHLPMHAMAQRNPLSHLPMHP